MSARCDLQVHSRYSDRPSEWVLRKLGVPESYTEPGLLYERLRAEGMDFVTVTDHNRLDGAEEIAGRTGVFLGEEVTTYFPEDGCKIHVLVWNLDADEHAEIARLRQDIHALAAWLRSAGLPHGVAHPLCAVNGRLTVAHVEKLMLLFRTFEVVNGNRHPMVAEVTRAVLDSMTAARLQELAERHGIEPPEPDFWRKSQFGSSDDHGSLYPGKTWTEVDVDCATPEEFLRRVMAGEGKACGQAGDSLRFSNSIYNIVFSYASDRLGQTAPRGMKLMRDVAARFLEGRNPVQFSFGEMVGHVSEAVRTGKAMDFIKPGEPSLNRQLVSYLLDPRVKKDLDRIIASEPDAERRTFRMASKITNDLIYRLFQNAISKVDSGDLVDSLQPLSGMIPLVAAVAPYGFAFHAMHADRRLLRAASDRFLPQPPPGLARRKLAWFTDTLEDVNGVARTIRTMSRAALKSGEDLVVVTCRSDSKVHDIRLMNFEPVGEFELPEYKLQKLSFPPVLDMIDYIEREGVTECVISTPGPVGLTALAAAKLLGLPTSGIYHTDFPQYVRILTEDEMMETMMWSFMHWFYSQLDLVYVNSEFYRQCWIDRGIPPQSLEILPRGLDTELFQPGHRDREFWRSRGALGPVLLYVGRVSKEKELAFLVDVYKRLRADGMKLSLAVVGEGPYEEEMRKLVPEAVFTGVLSGFELGAAYASADLFVFPSTTDTFGNVVIEAQACGLPTLVSDVGGPRELVHDRVQGMVLPANDPDAWCRAVREYLDQPPTAAEIEANVAALQEQRSWDTAFHKFWNRR